MDKYELMKRTKDFAHRCVKLGLALPSNPLGQHIEKQLIRCSTSVAANYRAVCVSQSKRDFEAKLSRVVEEADESCFWLEFLIEESLLRAPRVSLLLKEGRELTSVFIAARKTSQSRAKLLNSKS